MYRHHLRRSLKKTQRKSCLEKLTIGTIGAFVEVATVFTSGQIQLR